MFDIYDDYYEDDLDFGLEGLFGDAEHTVASLLNTVRDNVATKVTSVVQADELIDTISGEAVEFNQLLIDMSDAIRSFERGNISKEEMMGICSNAGKELKANCKTLGLCGDVFSPDDDITEDEIAMIREFIIGCKSVVEERRAQLAGEEGADQAGKAGTIVNAAEGLLYQLDEYSDDYASEAAGDNRIAQQIRNSTDAKTADVLYKQGKALYKAGSKDKAVGTIKKAQALYTKCLNKVKSSTERINVERTAGSMNGYGIKDKYRRTVAANYGAGSAITYFEDKIAACKALIMKWTNMSESRSFNELKKQYKEELKNERKANRTARKEERKANRASRKENRANNRAEKRANREARKEEKRAAKLAAADESYLDLIILESELGIDFNDYDSYEEALYEVANEAYVDTMIAEEGFYDDEEYLSDDDYYDYY